MHLLDELLQHLLGYGEVGDDAVFHRPDHIDVPWRFAEHLLGFLADGLDRAFAVWSTFLADGDDRWLVEHDSFAAHVDQRVRGAEIDREVVGEVSAQKSEHGCVVPVAAPGAERYVSTL